MSDNLYPGDTPAHYQIRVRGRLDPHWSHWFDGLTITHDADGNTPRSAGWRYPW
jgi:hypothetical protein